MYNPQDSINIAYNYIQGLKAKGHSYGGYPVYNVTKDDLTALKVVTDKYGIPFEWMINLINFESGRTFNPAIQNSIGATGLIQFMGPTAAGPCLNTTTTALRAMTFKQQLVYVDKYLYCNLKNHLVGGKIPSHFTQGDLFMTIFYPVAVGRPDFVFPENVQRANSGISKPYDYAQRALAASVFPLTMFPYTLTEVKKKFGDVAKRHPRVTIAVFIIAIVLIISAILLLIYRKKVATAITKL